MTSAASILDAASGNATFSVGRLQDFGNTESIHVMAASTVVRLVKPFMRTSVVFSIEGGEFIERCPVHQKIATKYKEFSSMLLDVR